MTVDEVFEILREYLKIHNGEFPSVEQFAEYSSLTTEVISKLYRRWVSQGKIIKKGNSYVLYEEDGKDKLFTEPKKFEPDNLVVMSKPVLVKKENTEKKQLLSIWSAIKLRA